MDVVARDEAGTEADHEGGIAARRFPVVLLHARVDENVGPEAREDRPLGIHGHGDEVRRGAELRDGGAPGHHALHDALAREYGLGEGHEPAHGQRLGPLQDDDREAGQEEEARGGRPQFPAAPHDHGRGRHHGR